MSEAGEQTDSQYMERAIELARRGVGRVSPNPAVGAVLVSDGQVVGEGFFLYEHLKHAEIYALEQAGMRARGATLYCSLEPCCFLGRTPPCTDALIDAAIGRAVIAVADPHPRVRGRGIQQLRDTGIAVEVGLMQDRSQSVNEAFFKFATQGLPFIHTVRAVDISSDRRGTGSQGRSTIQSSGQTPGRLPGRPWRPSAEFVKTARGYDAIVIESADEPSLAILQELLEKPRHRPLVVAVPSECFKRLQETVRLLGHPERAMVIGLGKAEGDGSVPAPGDAGNESIAPLIELRVQSLLVLPSLAGTTPVSSEPSSSKSAWVPLWLAGGRFGAADRVTYLVPAESRPELQQRINHGLKDAVISEAEGFVEFTGKVTTDLTGEFTGDR